MLATQTTMPIITLTPTLKASVSEGASYLAPYLVNVWVGARPQIEEGELITPLVQILGPDVEETKRQLRDWLEATEYDQAIATLGISHNAIYKLRLALGLVGSRGGRRRGAGRKPAKKGEGDSSE